MSTTAEVHRGYRAVLRDPGKPSLPPQTKTTATWDPSRPPNLLSRPFSRPRFQYKNLVLLYRDSTCSLRYFETNLFCYKNLPNPLIDNVKTTLTWNILASFIIFNIKGIVQRKLRWVESGVNWWVMLHDWGARHYFLTLKGHYLVFRIKSFAATWAQIFGNEGKNWWSAENGV